MTSTVITVPYDTKTYPELEHTTGIWNSFILSHSIIIIETGYENRIKSYILMITAQNNNFHVTLYGNMFSHYQ